MMKYLISIVLISVLVVQTLSSQIILETLDGENLFINNGLGRPSQALSSFSSKDKSISLNLFLKKGTASPRYNFFEIKGKANENITTFFKDNKIQPGIKFSYAFGKTHLLSTISSTPGATPGFTDWFFVKVGYGVDKFNIFDQDTAFASQLTKERFESLSLQFNYAVLIKGNHVLAINAGYKEASNYSELKKVELEDRETIVDPATNNSRDIITKTTGRMGEFKEFDSYPFSVSLSKIPEDTTSVVKLGYSIYYQTKFGLDETKSNLGFNLFFTKIDEKTKIRNTSGGLFIEARDAFDAAGKNNSLIERIVIGANARIRIGVLN